MEKQEGKKNLAPVKVLSKDIELGILSKSEAQAKWRRQKELDARMKAYETKAKADIEAEMGAQKAPEKSKEPEPETKPKKGLKKA